MLDKRTKKKLITQKFNDKGEEKNPSQFFDRIRRQTDKAIQHLALIAEKVPDEEQTKRELFRENKLIPLFYAILTSPKEHDIIRAFEKRISPRKRHEAEQFELNDLEENLMKIRMNDVLYDNRRTGVAYTMLQAALAYFRMQYKLQEPNAIGADLIIKQFKEIDSIAISIVSSVLRRVRPEVSKKRRKRKF